MTLMEELKTLLKKDERLVSGDKLLKNKIIELTLKLDKDLIKLLLSNKKIKEHFFEEVDKTLIFDKEKFMKFVDNKEFLPDSYTAFKNKIGLTADKKYIAENKEVVLSWPYKDCVLEGGQEKGDEKRNEIFYNEILAPEEIDRLLDPKVFTNFKRIDAKGKHEVTEIKPTDNLIIKGNNLLVLHSLKKRFEGQVKLIYIDPPYNTGNDEFEYNDNFNHSTWLTFMKNRLEVARDLLSDDGFICVQIGDREVGYLNVLMDNIFKDNFLNKITIKTRAAAGFKVVNLGLSEVAEYIFVYAKNKKNANPHKLFTKTSYDTNYSLIIKNKKDDYKRWIIGTIEDELKKELEQLSKFNLKKEYFSIIKKQLFAEYAMKHSDIVFRYTVINKDAGKETLEAKEKSLKNPSIVIKVKTSKGDVRYVHQGQQITFYKNKIRKINGELTPSKMLTNIWTDIAWEGISREGKVTLRQGKKPEKLLQRLIEMFSNKGDIVLDFFTGTGTTCAVAHKLGRQYIGIEQLDYGKNSAVVRLKNVIGKSNSNGKLTETIEDFDTSGISKAVNWKGGGEFVYCELKELNETFVQKIKEANDSEELLKIWEEMKKQAFLSYRVDPELFDDNIEEFKKLSVEEQKKLLIKCLDANNLYVNYSEIKDKQYKVSKEDIDLNRLFYGDL